MTGTGEGFERSDVAWAAWRRRPDGAIDVVLRLQTEEGLRRERRAYPDLDAAVTELGASFGEVVDRVRDAGRDRGRWRP